MNGQSPLLQNYFVKDEDCSQQNEPKVEHGPPNLTRTLYSPQQVLNMNLTVKALIIEILAIEHQVPFFVHNFMRLMWLKSGSKLHRLIDPPLVGEVNANFCG
jgi:hypothetical protein